jgi:CheY-like chemotaxis protein
MPAADRFKSKTLSPDELQALLDKLDATEANPARRGGRNGRNAVASAPGGAAGGVAGANRRAAERASFRRTDIRLQITHPGGGTIDCTVPARDLSASGISLLYWGFLHAGTEVRVTLPVDAGGEELVDGYVAWCRHVVGPHHLIGLRFARKISPRQFGCRAAPRDEGEPGGLTMSGVSISTEHVDAATLRGTVLLIDADDLHRDLFKHHLRGTAVTPILAANAAAAFAAIDGGQKIDLLIADLGADGEASHTAALDAIRTCRAAGYVGPLAVLTADSSPARMRDVEGRVSAILHKPYDRARLLHLLSLWLRDSTAAQGARPSRWAPGLVEPPVRSDLAGDPLMHELIGKFVAKARDLADRVGHAVDKGDLPEARRCCATLKGAGGSFGFAVVSRAAAEALLALDASQSVAESTPALRKLTSLCRRLAGPPPATSSPARPTPAAAA